MSFRLVLGAAVTLLLGLVGPAFSSEVPAVVLLTSVETPKIWYRSSDYSLDQDLEGAFRKGFEGSGYRVVVKSRATQDDLRQALTDPGNIALFWVSHAAESAILDIEGAEVKALFQTIHPGLRWLGVIGCNALKVFEGFRERGFYRSNTNLKIDASDTVVNARSWLIASMNRSVETLADAASTATYRTFQQEDRFEFVTVPRIVARPDLLVPRRSEKCASERGVPFVVERELPSHSVGKRIPSIQVLLGDRLLGFFPSPHEGERRQVESFFVPSKELIGKKAIKIRLQSGHAEEGVLPLELGRFVFHSVLRPEAWKVFSDQNGAPIGVTSHLYRYEGTERFTAESERDHSSWSCDAGRGELAALKGKLNAAQGVVFEKVFSSGFADAWRDADGLVWSDPNPKQKFSGLSSYKDALNYCRERGARLPTVSEFARADRQGMAKIDQDLASRSYWAEGPSIYVLMPSAEESFVERPLKGAIKQFFCVR